MELQTRTYQPPGLCHCRANDEGLKTPERSWAEPSRACHKHRPADVTVLATALRASRLAGRPGVALRLDVLRLMFREQQQGVSQTDSCKLHTGDWNGCRLALTVGTDNQTHTQARGIFSPVQISISFIGVGSICGGGHTDLYMLFWADWDARMTLRWYPWPTIDWTIPFLQGKPLLSCSDPCKGKTGQQQNHSLHHSAHF